MVERLLNAGVSTDEAESIAKSFGGDSETAVEETVDVDRLTKAMEGIKDAFDAAPEAESDVDSAIQEATDIVDAVTKGADALLAEHREQFEALSKGILLLTQEVSELRGQVSSNGSAMAKSLGSAADALNEPALRKSVSASTIEQIPTPGESPIGDFHPQSLIAKALTEIRSEDVLDTRKAELRKAISLLEAGAIPASVATTYSLSATA
jgi:hypothetical protein